MENKELQQAQELAKQIKSVQSVNYKGHTYSFALTTRALRMVENITKKTTSKLLDAIAGQELTMDELIVVMVQGFSAPLIKAGQDASAITEALCEEMLDEHSGLEVQVAKTFAEACTRKADLAAAASPNR